MQKHSTDQNWFTSELLWHQTEPAHIYFSNMYSKASIASA